MSFESLFAHQTHEFKRARKAAFGTLYVKDPILSAAPPRGAYVALGFQKAIPNILVPSTAAGGRLAIVFATVNGQANNCEIPGDSDRRVAKTAARIFGIGPDPADPDAGQVFGQLLKVEVLNRTGNTYFLSSAGGGVGGSSLVFDSLAGRGGQCLFPGAKAVFTRATLDSNVWSVEATEMRYRGMAQLGPNNTRFLSTIVTVGGSSSVTVQNTVFNYEIDGGHEPGNEHFAIRVRFEVSVLIDVALVGGVTELNLRVAAPVNGAGNFFPDSYPTGWGYRPRFGWLANMNEPDYLWPAPGPGFAATNNPNGTAVFGLGKLIRPSATGYTGDYDAVYACKLTGNSPDIINLRCLDMGFNEAFLGNNAYTIFAHGTIPYSKYNYVATLTAG